MNTSDPSIYKNIVTGTTKKKWKEVTVIIIDSEEEEEEEQPSLLPNHSNASSSNSKKPPSQVNTPTTPKSQIEVTTISDSEDENESKSTSVIVKKKPLINKPIKAPKVAGNIEVKTKPITAVVFPKTQSNTANRTKSSNSSSSSSSTSTSSNNYKLEEKINNKCDDDPLVNFEDLRKPTTTRSSEFYIKTSEFKITKSAYTQQQQRRSTQNLQQSPVRKASLDSFGTSPLSVKKGKFPPNDQRPLSIRESAKSTLLYFSPRRRSRSPDQQNRSTLPETHTSPIRRNSLSLYSSSSSSSNSNNSSSRQYIPNLLQLSLNSPIKTEPSTMPPPPSPTTRSPRGTNTSSPFRRPTFEKKKEYYEIEDEDGEIEDLENFVSAISARRKLFPTASERRVGQRKENNMQCPLCHLFFPKSDIHDHAADCVGNVEATAADDEDDHLRVGAKRGRQKKSIASMVALQQNERKRKNMGIVDTGPTNYYADSDGLALDGVGFNSEVTGMSWESAGQTRFG